MSSITDFSKIISRHEIEINIVLKTPLHIGGNFDDLNTDLPIIRTRTSNGSEGVPFIPGSSIKGVLRSASERLWHLLADDQDSQSCLLEEGGCSQKHKDEISKILDSNSYTEQQAFEKIYHLLCPTCRTYGAGSIASKVRVSNILLEKAKTVYRDGILIDRETGSVAPSAKFDYEYVEAGYEFTIQIEAENLDEENEKVLALALVQLKNNMLRLGGLQARGLGELEYKGGSVRKVTFSNKNKSEVLKYLLGKHTGEQVDLDTYLGEILGGESR